MKKKVCILCAGLLLLSGCGKVPKLSNGEDAVITYENGEKISVNDLYEKVKNDYALQALITLSDTYILEKEFADYKDTAKQNAEAYIKAYIEQYGDENTFLQMVQQAGYATIEAYQDYVYLTYMQSHAVEEYAKKQIKDEEIEKYYNDEVQGDLEISHILITPDVKDDMTDEEKKEAETKAQDTAKEVIQKLKDAKDVNEEFKKLVKEYSQDDNTKDKDGALGRITYGDLSSEYDELLDAAYKLKNGEFSTNVITTELGYHVILRTKSYEKESLDKLKDEIVEELATEYAKNNADVSVRALQDYRKQYGMNIEDDELKRQYAIYIQNLLASFNQSDEEDTDTSK